MKRMLIALSIAGMAMSSSGCALLFTKRPPSPPTYTPGQGYDCGSGRGLAVVDVVFAAAEAAASVGLYYSRRAHDIGDVGAPFGFLVPAFVHAVSAGYGFSTSSRCERVVEALDHPPPVQVVTDVEGGPLAICAHDTQCSNHRICVAKRCVRPSPSPLAPPHPLQEAPPQPAPSTPAPAQRSSDQIAP